MARYTVHGGHAKHGNKYCGAVGYCSESLVDRAICASVIKWLQYAGHTAYDCSVDSGISQSNIVSKIKKNINSYKNVTCNVSIHLNSDNNPGKDKSDGKLKGVETWIYPNDTNSYAIANRICIEEKTLGFKNRGVKSTTSLGVLKGIKNGGANILVECFFCDDEDDYKLFNKLGADAIGKAIAEGILNKTIQEKSSYTWQGVDYSPVFNANYYALHNKDVVDARGSAAAKLFEHFYTFGMKEGRQASADFNVKIYRENYEDLRNKFGNNYPLYYQHYCVKGKNEGREGI